MVHTELSSSLPCSELKACQKYHSKELVFLGKACQCTGEDKQFETLMGLLPTLCLLFCQSLLSPKICHSLSTRAVQSMQNMLSRKDKASGMSPWTGFTKSVAFFWRLDKIRGSRPSTALVSVLSQLGVPRNAPLPEAALLKWGKHPSWNSGESHTALMYQPL